MWQVNTIQGLEKTQKISFEGGTHIDDFLDVIEQAKNAMTPEQRAELADAAFDNLQYFLIGGAGVGIGAFLILDDMADFGKFNFGWTPLWRKEHPTWFHHWQYGLIALIVGLVFLGIGLWLTLKQIGWKPSQLREIMDYSD